MKQTRFFGSLFAAALLLAAGCGDKDKEIEEPPTPRPDVPVIAVDSPAQIPATGGRGEIRYTITNPTEEAVLTAEPDEQWLQIEEIGDRTISYKAEVHTGDEPRTATVTLSYPGAESIRVTLTQITPSTPKTLTFEIEILEVTSRTVIVNCTPSDPRATYVAMATYKSTYESFESEEERFESDYNYFLEWGPAFGATTPEEAVGLFLRTGNMEEYDIQLDQPQQDYYFYAYGMNLDGTITSPHIFKVPFRTTEPEQQECTFEFSVRPGISYTQANVYPSSIYVSYIWGVLPADEFDAMGDDPAQAIVDQIKAQIEANPDIRFGEFITYHNRKASYSNLEQDKEYVVYAFGSDVTGFVTTPIMTHRFTEKRLPRVECSFSLTFESVRASTFAVRIAPSDNSVRWFAYTLPYEMLENYNSIEAMTEDVIDILFDLGIDFSQDETYIHSGPQLLSSYDLMGSELDPRTKQLAAVFGVNDDGCRVTEISQGVVTTIEEGRPSNLTVGIEALVSGYDSAEVKFTPSVWEAYFFDLQPKEYYETFPSDESFMNELLFYYGSNSLLPYKMAIGPASMSVEKQLMPGTDYIGVAFGIDKIISTPLFSKVFTTGSVPLGGTAGIDRIDCTIEDGDVYYAKDPSLYAACKGKAVVTFAVESPANAASCYLANFSRLDASITDQRLTDMIVGRGDTCDDLPSYIMEWNEPNIAAALALDASGKAGSIRRKEFTPTKADVQRIPRSRAVRLHAACESRAVRMPEWNGVEQRSEECFVLHNGMNERGPVDSQPGILFTAGKQDGPAGEAALLRKLRDGANR